MIRYVVFTQEELDAIKSGFDVVKSIDQDGHLVVYTNDEKYTEMLMSMKEKEFTDE